MASTCLTGRLEVKIGGKKSDIWQKKKVFQWVWSQRFQKHSVVCNKWEANNKRKVWKMTKVWGKLLLCDAVGYWILNRKSFFFKYFICKYHVEIDKQNTHDMWHLAPWQTHPDTENICCTISPLNLSWHNAIIELCDKKTATLLDNQIL